MYTTASSTHKTAIPSVRALQTLFLYSGPIHADGTHTFTSTAQLIGHASATAYQFAREAILSGQLIDFGEFDLSKPSPVLRDVLVQNTGQALFAGAPAAFTTGFHTGGNTAPERMLFVQHPLKGHVAVFSVTMHQERLLARWLVTADEHQGFWLGPIPKCEQEILVTSTKILALLATALHLDTLPPYDPGTTSVDLGMSLLPSFFRVVLPLFSSGG